MIRALDRPLARGHVRSIRATMLAGLLLTAAASTQAETLRGHLSGLADRNGDFDLRLRFFDTATSDAFRAEHRFHSVTLREGHFSIALDSTAAHRVAIPASAAFVEIALRPSARPYAAFRPAPPRRRLQRSNGDVLVASVTSHGPETGHARTISGPAPGPGPDDRMADLE